MRIVLLAAAVMLALSACTGQQDPLSTTASQKEVAVSSANPLLQASTLPFGAPEFDKFKDTDYQPAIEEGMKRHLAEIRTIADSDEAPTFANTIEALERSGELLTRASQVFYMLTSANTNDTLQAAETALAPKQAAHRDEIYLDPKLFERVEAVYEQRDALSLDPEQKRLVEEYFKQFVRAGARLSDADKAALRQLNQDESTLSTEFGNKLLAANTAGAVIVSDRERLAGLSEADIAAAAEAAKSRGKKGKWALSLQNTTQQPALTSLQDRELRIRLLEASLMRAERGDANDTRVGIQRLARLRAQQAELLGFPSYAAYRLDDQMAKTPEAAEKLLTDTVPAATAKARSELAKIQAVINQGRRSLLVPPRDAMARVQAVLSGEDGGFIATAADWNFYAEQVRKAEYDLDESQTRPYFELNRVLNDGVFFAANQLYGITLKERTDLPVYQADVRVFDVIDDDDKQLALFYLDPFKRDNKQGGAWMGNFIEQNGLTGEIPVIYNVTNITRPADGQPALLTWDEVTTLFHEFGHALHGMFSRTRYPSLAGTNVSRDFVEFPSQFNEHWAADPSVLANYAKHYQTGKAMPQELLDKVLKARTFNQGYATTEYLAAALLDMAWHRLPADAHMQDVNLFETETLERFHVDLEEVPPRYRTSYFSHIWKGGYAAGYYAYFWAEVLDHDAFRWFAENGGLTRENGQVFRDKILSIGNSRDLAVAFREFRGRDPDVEPLLEHRGLK
ncbi:MAG: M3 family metallopeptidase [Xanthomonadaceae bacterium]|jgi:peptidyl-dipeptidase Dcp|nr:M3 family metallopeptidase [Xanthomonadaceae bacterium]